MKVWICVSSPKGSVHCHATVADDAAERCYALPKEADRVAFWSTETGVALPQGNVLTWSPMRRF